MELSSSFVATSSSSSSFAGGVRLHSGLAAGWSRGRQGGARSVTTCAAKGVHAWAAMDLRLFRAIKWLKLIRNALSPTAAAVVSQIKLALQAGKANPAPPVGPALGSKARPLSRA